MRGDDGHRAVELVAHDAATNVFTGKLSALEIERVAVAVVRRHAEYADVTIVLDVAHLPVVRNVAPDEIAADRTPRRSFRPQRAGPQTLDRSVRLAQVVEHLFDR